MISEVLDKNFQNFINSGICWSVMTVRFMRSFGGWVSRITACCLCAWAAFSAFPLVLPRRGSAARLCSRWIGAQVYNLDLGSCPWWYLAINTEVFAGASTSVHVLMSTLSLLGNWQALFDSFSSVEPFGQSFGGMVLPKLCASYFRWVLILKFVIVQIAHLSRASIGASCSLAIAGFLPIWNHGFQTKFYLLLIFFMFLRLYRTKISTSVGSSLQRIEMRKTWICTPYVFMCFLILSEGAYGVLLCNFVIPDPMV